MLRLSADCSADRKGNGHGPQQRLEDYHQSFRYAEDLREDDAEAVKRLPKCACSLCKDIFERFETEPELLERVITGNES